MSLSEDEVHAKLKRIALAQRALRKIRIKESLAEWARYRGFEPAAHHLLIIREIERFLASEDEEVLLLFAPPGSAKALALDTPIPTPEGWRRIDELNEGDRVFDENGRPCKIVRVSEIFRNRPVYAVRTDCGDEIIADEDHEWMVRLCGKPRVGKRHEPRPFKLKTTKYLHRRRAKRPMIVRAKALDLPDANLPIAPYLLGLWLGDGSSGQMVITSDPDDQKWIRQELARLGYTTTDRSEPKNFGISDVRHLFVGLGLIHDPMHSTYGRKYIPAMYLRASIPQRLALLQGLIDTDGTVCRKRGMTTFCSTNLKIAEGVRELVRSLGRKAGWSEGRAMLYGKDCGPVYKVSFYHREAARLPRKRKLCRDQERTPNTYIEVEPHGVADTVCIEVDSPSHLFLCGRSMTPTHNSTYVSVLFPSWYLASHPDHKILAATHSVEFAAQWGRRVRNDIATDSHMLGITLAEDSRASDRWSLTSGGGYWGVGAGTAIAGYRADLAIGDDFFGTRQDAYSETVRQTRWSWYLNDFSTRLKPKAKRVLMSTRWHEEDVVGHILVQMEQGQVRGRVVTIPAIAEAGDQLGRPVGTYLWDDPDGYNYGNFLRARQRESSPMMWAALYQQRPAPEEGDYFKVEWLRPYDSLPALDTLRIIGASDYAVTADGGDFTVHVVIGLDSTGTPWLLDLWRGQTDSAIWIDAWCDLVQKWKPFEWGEESGQIRAAIGPFLEKRARERHAYVYRRQIPSRADKAARAQAIRGLMAMRGLMVPEREPWYEPFRAELLGFPAGKYDDQVDAISLVGQLFDTALDGRLGSEEDEYEDRSWQRGRSEVTGY